MLRDQELVDFEVDPLTGEARIIDVAPTLAKLLGVDVPKDAEGGVIYDILDRIGK